MNVTFSLDLPMPPSTNAIWRSRRGSNGKPQHYLDPRYRAWKRDCDAFWMADSRKAVFSGPVNVSIILSDAKRRGDADNRIKAVLDWLQRVEIIKNDSYVEKVSAEWGEAPLGCSITITSTDRSRLSYGQGTSVFIPRKVREVS